MNPELVAWALGIRQGRNDAASLLARCITDEMTRSILGDPTIAGKLSSVPEHRRAAAAATLGVIVRNRSLRHNDKVPLGVALSHLPGKNAAVTLAAAVSTPQHVALRILANALEQVAHLTAVDLEEFACLLTEWDDLGPGDRSEFLVRFHTAHRA